MFTKQQLLCTCMRAVLDLQLVIVSSIAKTFFFFGKNFLACDVSSKHCLCLVYALQ